MSVREQGSATAVLTERERQVLALVAKGLTNAEIASQLGVTFPTAKWHVGEIISKLGVASREEAVAVWKEDRSLGARTSRAFRALLAVPVAKLALGGTIGAAGIAGAGAIAFAVVATMPADASPNVVMQVETSTIAPTATVTPDPGPRPMPTNPALDARGCPYGYAAGEYCAYTVFPQLVAADKGGCDLSGASFPMPPKLDFVDLSNCNLSGTTWDGPFMNDATLAGANMDNISIIAGTIAEATFAGASMRGANLDRVQLFGADFSGVDLTAATLINVGVTGVIWSGAICPDGSSADTHGGTCVGTPGVTTRAD
ncbi:MAG TPA: LuxR C-terminal-related transcriptional regulator [Tepidiformaceae bacterium]|nr:LuxR C-terminal-related transcriptional regulator [Tepidiformaceae bacterium]